MERRLLLALALTAAVLLLTPLFFPSPPRTPTVGTPVADTVDQIPRAVDSSQVEAASPAAVESPPAVDTSAISRATIAVDTIAVRTPVAIYRFSTLGAAPIGATMLEYRALGTSQEGFVELGRAPVPILSYGLVRGGDTLSLDRVPFSVAGNDAVSATGAEPLTFRAVLPGGGVVSIAYTFVPDSYVVRVRGEVSPTTAGPLLIRMPQGIRSFEADSVDDLRHLAYVFKPVNDDARSAPFDKLEDQRRVEPGPFTWVGSKTKYFLAALLVEPQQQPFSGLVLSGGPEIDGTVMQASAIFAKQLEPGGSFAFEIYIGPQEWERLRAMGRELENANPYGGFMQGFVQPFATIVMRLLLWMHRTFELGYGWVLVIFGVAVRLILWPLNQGAMRTSLRMQRIQPQLMEAQKRYRQQPEKAHQEMMRIYKEHGLSPFSMFSGCLPLLLPMPVLFALFFVFQNTIEFRGVSFLWLPDISLKDPYYIIPILMGASMFLLSWIGMRGVPPNPQTKMMTYIFPGMMTFLFLTFPSGLNLYYAVQNIAALPQQWLIARERQKAGPPPQPAK